MARDLKSKIVTREEAVAGIHDGQVIMFGDWHGEFTAEELITEVLKKGVKDIDAIAVSGGMPDQGLGRLISRATNSYMALAADLVIAEVEELVEVGELGPDDIDVPAPIVDMVYVRTGEKKPFCPMWQRAKAKAEAKAREAAEGGSK